MALNMSPSELDPVFAADTPITPDPTTGPKASSKGYATREAMIARLVAGGYTAEEAAKVVDSELARSGPRPQGMFDQDNSPAGMENLRQGISNQRASERRMGIFEDNYNEATGAPPSQPVVAAPTPDDMEPMTADQLRDGGRNPYMEPGPNMPDGSKAAGPRQMMTEREADAYNIRTPNDSGSYNPSPRDDANAARGLWPVFTPSGEVSYSTGTGNRPMYSDDPGNPVGAPGRLGPRRDLEPGFNLEGMPGPTGQVYVYRQNQAAKDRQSAYMKERQLYRDAEIQGVSPASLLAQSPELAEELTAGGQRDRVGARAANEGARQAAAAKREEAWRAQMMLGGGRPTGGIGGSKAVVNALESLPEDQRNSSLRYMLPGGQLAAAVDGRHNEQLSELGLRVATGRGFQPTDPRLVDSQVDEMKRRKREADPAEAGREDLAAGKATSPVAMKEADRLAEQYDSGDEGVWWLGGRDGMSDDDEANLAAALVRDYGMGETLANETARRAADRRRWYRKRGPLAAAPPAAPAGAAPPPAGR